VHPSAPLVVHVRPLGVELAVYALIGLPPSLAGALQVTLAPPLPALALTPLGAPGTVAVPVAVV
jgi:hypothetical protein